MIRILTASVGLTLLAILGGLATFGIETSLEWLLAQVGINAPEQNFVDRSHPSAATSLALLVVASLAATLYIVWPKQRKRTEEFNALSTILPAHSYRLPLYISESGAYGFIIFKVYEDHWNKNHKLYHENVFWSQDQNTDGNVLLHVLVMQDKNYGYIPISATENIYGTIDLVVRYHGLYLAWMKFFLATNEMLSEAPIPFRLAISSGFTYCATVIAKTQEKRFDRLGAQLIAFLTDEKAVEPQKPKGLRLSEIRITVGGFSNKISVAFTHPIAQKARLKDLLQETSMQFPFASMGNVVFEPPQVVG